MVDAPLTLQTIQREVVSCREWIDEKANRCGAPSEYILWGKLIPADGLGPRCYDHVAKWVSASALAPRSTWAIVDLAGLVQAIKEAHEDASL